jgi:hypothetical protein
LKIGQEIKNVSYSNSFEIFFPEISKFRTIRSHFGLTDFGFCQLAQCPACAEKASKSRKESDAASVADAKVLFLDHVHRVAQFVREHKKVLPIVWDDMLRSIPLQILQVNPIK